MSNGLANNPRILACPKDRRPPAKDWASLRNQNISYFLNPNADESTPQAILAGDRNLTTNGVAVKPGLLTLTSNAVVGISSEMHNDAGNILFSDGGVQQLTSHALQSIVQAAGAFTNRLAVP